MQIKKNILPVKYWIGIDATIADKALIEKLVSDSFNIVKSKPHKPKRENCFYS